MSKNQRKTIYFWKTNKKVLEKFVFYILSCIFVQGNKKNAMKKNAEGLLYDVNGFTMSKQFANNKVTLQELQSCVGGYIEFIYLPNNKILVVNEEGKINDLPLNAIATMEFWDSIGDTLVGDVLLIDQKFID